MKIRRLLTGEAISFLVILYRVQYVTDIADAAFGEFTVVRPISARGRSEHDVIAMQTAWPTFGWKIVLRETKGERWTKKY